MSHWAVVDHTYPHLPTHTLILYPQSADTYNRQIYTTVIMKDTHNTHTDTILILPPSDTYDWQMYHGHHEDTLTHTLCSQSADTYDRQILTIGR